MAMYLLTGVLETGDGITYANITCQVQKNCALLGTNVRIAFS